MTANNNHFPYHKQGSRAETEERGPLPVDFFGAEARAGKTRKLKILELEELFKNF